MRHPTDGTLRRLLDEPAGVADADREHVAGCPACLSGVAAAREDAAFAAAALSADCAVDVDAGWRRLSRAADAEGPGITPPRRRRAVLRSPVVAVFGAVVLLAGAGAAAAVDWLQIFRAEQIIPVTAPKADLIKLPDLSDFGELQVTEKIDMRKVAGASAAEKATGLTVPQVGTLPRGVTGDPAYHVVGRVSGDFTFSIEKTAKTAAAAGVTLPPAPPGLDGSRFRLVAGPGVAAVWSAGRPMPALIVARANALTAYASTVPFETVRGYLLSLRILPENVAAQLSGLAGVGGMTLPLFTSTDRMSTSTSDVGGLPATVLARRDGTMAAVIWMDGGVVTAVAGSLSTGEALATARGLRRTR
ncbi:hypothetical protein [Sinosporangium siamense]|uniref:Uncharacterized protein n=1 Tax=Sinosporangium siamense TaxID=1367973 RepID=A0A919V6H4_9ACTN|nr:hypothetical protein [Sinosporangium siamense]GII94065.1 hypothetical protein Ssi02_42960 [Sinosporangium siamense]